MCCSLCIGREGVLEAARLTMRVVQNVFLFGLAGSIPKELGDLSELTECSLHSNQLTGV